MPFLSFASLLLLDEVLTLLPHSENGMVLSMDHLTYDANDIVKVHLHISTQRVSFVRYRHTHFWDRVENSFIGAREID